MQFHLMAFEGPDAYARVGGLASRVEGLARALASHDFEVHLWFIGDPDAPADECSDGVQLHRWCQWISRHHPRGVYDGEEGKRMDLCRSLPPQLAARLAPHLHGGGHAVVLAEEWQTADAITHLDFLLRRAGLRERASLLWNANHSFGFERIDWARLDAAATITTVSRYMKLSMSPLGVNPIVIPNGLGPESYGAPECAVTALRRQLAGRTALVKIARFDPSKRWLEAVRITAQMKSLGWRPLLIARGGGEAHGGEFRASVAAAGLTLARRHLPGPGVLGLLDATRRLQGVDVLELTSHVDPDARRVLLAGAAVVLANSRYEPFGLVGLEAMAAGGLACTGASGEDYALAGQNALVVETDDPDEFLGLYRPLREAPERELPLRVAGRATAAEYAWPRVLDRVLLPRVEMARSAARA
jgi:glycosyltransferase involved in cell wall biosynthesis